jgi:cephalosporin-C deacetylase-like acetyl esterase
VQRNLLAATLLVLTWCAPERAHAVALEVYGRLPKLENVALSPDGSRLACIQTQGDSRLLVIYSVSDHKATHGVRLRETKVRDLEWADDEHLMVITSSTALPAGLMGRTHEWEMLDVYDLNTHKVTPVPRFDVQTTEHFMNVVIGRPMVRAVNGHTVVFVPGFYIERLTLPALFRVDLQTGQQSIVRRGSLDWQGWLVDEAGEVAVEEDYFDRDRRWVIKIRRDGRLQEVAYGHETIEHPQVLGFGPMPDSLLIDSIEEGNPVWRLMSLKDGALMPLPAHRFGLDEPIEDRVSYRMIGGVSIGDDNRYLFFDPAMDQHWEAIERAFNGEHLQLASFSQAFDKVVVRVDGTRDGYIYALVDLKTMSAQSLGQVYQGVTPLEVRRLTYHAADGLEIPAYLTLPRRPDPKGLPLIVLVHGGPAARDTADFDWWSQALADQGYAVLRPNYRGSTLTWQFTSAGFGEWGRKMQTDVSDGVRYLAREGIIDPARVCIVGASYGGYAALAGVTLDPGIYRCAVSVAGISDLKRMLEWWQEGHAYDQVTLRYWDRFLGVSGSRDPGLDAISPVRHVDVVTVPVLLIHGRDDTVVPFEQSTFMFDALRKARKQVDLVTLKHEDHWLSRSETRLQMLESCVAFLRKNNPPD